MAAGTALRAQSLGWSIGSKRIVPVEGRQGIAADSNYYYAFRAARRSTKYDSRAAGR